MKQTKAEITTRLNRIAKPATGWLSEAQYREENRADLKKSQRIALKVLRTLRARNMSQIQLAKILSVTPQQVNKWVKGKENFTLVTLTKIEDALSIKLVKILDAKAEVKVIKHSTYQFKIVIQTEEKEKPIEYKNLGEWSENIDLLPGITTIAEPESEYFCS
jgi:transcriptional regulator with XRE-family HTH domain